MGHFPTSGAKRLLLAILVGFSGTAWAQTIKVSGQVTDTQGEPLIGVTVASGQTGTATDINGNYTISASAEGKLQFSYIGYNTETRNVEGRSVINVTMTENATTLGDLVVVGYGQMKKSDLTGAVGSLSGSDLKDAPVNNIGSAMQGKIAGVQIIDAPVPGENVTIKVRGLGSIRNSDPLVVIDGVPTDLSLNSLNPQDIERIDVLKDASATAIYGSRGANGVVMVTTRKGASGNSKLSANVSISWQNASKKMDYLDAAGYASLSNDMMNQSGRNPNPLWADPSSLVGGTNWVDELLQTGLMQNYNLSYSGGNDKSHYYVSAGYLNQTGVVKNVKYDRFTFQTNNDAQVLKWLKFSNDLLFSADVKKNGSYNMLDAMHALPVFPVKEENGEWSGPSGNADWYGSVRNPVGNNDVYRSTTKGYNFLANIAADVNITPWLSFRSVFGYDAKLWFIESFSPKYDWKPTPVEESSNYQSDNKSFTYLTDNFFTFDHIFGKKHHVNAMLGTSYQWNNNSYLNAQMNGFLFDAIHQMNNGQTMKDIAGSKYEWAIFSLMARANYTFDDRYLLTATVRHDGSSRFGPKHRWGTFPSVSAAWRISKEAFFPQDKALSDLKLRLGYGQTGSQNSASFYGYMPTMNTLVYPFGYQDKNQAALIAQTLANPYLHWETVEQWNGGVDLSFLNGRVNISLDGYIKNTRDMLVKAAIPITSGFEDTSETLTNAGKMRNIGWELSVNSINITAPFEWETNFILTYNKNKIKYLNTDVPLYGDQLNNSYVTMQAVGYPMNVFYGYVTDGIFQTPEEVEAHAIQPGAEPGDIRFRDLNNDGIINDEDRTVIGNPSPTWLFSMNNRFAWRGFELQVYLQGVGGNKIYNYSRITMESMSAAYNQYASVADRWTGYGTSYDMPRAVWADPNQNSRVSDRWVENGSYLRVKNITLAYTFPDKWLRCLGVTNARLAFSCENVATITKYKGFDPEVGVNGIDYSHFPTPRTFNFSLSFNL